jgi:hypothetical protein
LLITHKAIRVGFHIQSQLHKEDTCCPFQVNTIVVEIDDGNPLPITPLGSQSSSMVLSQGASSSVQGTLEKDADASSTTPMVQNTELTTTPQSTGTLVTIR